MSSDESRAARWEVQCIYIALREAAQHWQALIVGEGITVSWPLDKPSTRRNVTGMRLFRSRIPVDKKR